MPRRGRLGSQSPQCGTSVWRGPELLPAQYSTTRASPGVAERGPFKKGGGARVERQSPWPRAPPPPSAQHTDSECPDVGVAVGDRWRNVCICDRAFCSDLFESSAFRPPPPTAVPLLLKSATGGPHARPRLLHNVTFHLFRLPSAAPQLNFAAVAQGAGLGLGAAASLSQ